MAAMRTVSVQDVRRLFVVKQRLDGGERPSMLQTFRDLGCIQLDPIQASCQNAQTGAVEPAWGI
jgi:uncharacterized protein YcaQ